MVVSYNGNYLFSIIDIERNLKFRIRIINKFVVGNIDIWFIKDISNFCDFGFYLKCNINKLSLFFFKFSCLFCFLDISNGVIVMMIKLKYFIVCILYIYYGVIIFVYKFIRDVFKINI